jgi:hypothetical protein
VPFRYLFPRSLSQYFGGIIDRNKKDLILNFVIFRKVLFECRSYTKFFEVLRDSLGLLFLDFVAHYKSKVMTLSGLKLQHIYVVQLLIF